MSEQGAAPTKVERDEPRDATATARVVAGAALILVGGLWLLDAAGVLALRWQLVLPAALTAVGVALLVTARRGAHGILVGAGIVLGLLVLGSGTVTGEATGVGDRAERPTDAVTAEAGYELGVGSLRVDLTEVTDLAEGAAIPVSVGIGEVVVQLPDGVGARIEGSVGIGEVTILGRSRGGMGVSVEEEVAGDPVVDLEVSAGIGRVEVVR